MRIAFNQLLLGILLAALFPSCGTLGAGSHVYCETIQVPCPSDSVIEQLARLKFSGRFNDARSFPDGLQGEAWKMHSFYFFDAKHQILVRLEVPLHTSKSTKLHLASINDFTVSSKWLGFTEVPAAKKKTIQTWFSQVIQPALMCNSAATR